MKALLPRGGRQARQLWQLLAERQFSSKFSRTSVFMQTGLKIRELPMVVQKVNDVLKIEELNNIKPVIATALPSIQDQELMEQINRIVNVRGLFKLLELLPADKVTPSVAVHCLKRIIYLNNNQARRNSLEIDHRLTDRIVLMNNNDGSFLRFAFINQLLDIVYRSQDPRVILDGLRVVCQDDFAEEQEKIVQYKERMYEETMTLITDGVFSLTQVCEAVQILSRFYSNDKKRSLELADNLWTGIMDKADKELNLNTLIPVFRTLPCLSQSRDLIYKLVSNKACDLWKELKTKDILEILRVLNLMGQYQCHYSQKATLGMISQWSLVNVHNLKEQELLALVVCMDKMEFVNKQFLQTLEKYMKVRGVQIVEADLVAATCDYCDHRKLISPLVLEASAEYFVEHYKNLNTPQINSIAKVFGNLNVHPMNGFKFWERLVTILEQKFAEFPPKDLVHLMLSFVHLEKYPVNLAPKVFNPNFMDRLETCPAADIARTKEEMDVLLASLKLEMGYQALGGYLTVSYKGIDRRVFNTARNIMEPLSVIIGDVKRIGTHVPIPQMCKNSLYVADMLIYPSVSESLLKIGKMTKKNNHIAVLIHTPDHYDRSKSKLLGRQAMRERQFKKLGYKVMSIDATNVRKLLMIPGQLQEYVKTEYDRAIKEP